MRPCCIPPMWQSACRPGTTRAAACCKTCWSRWASQHHSSARSGVSISHLPRIALHTCWLRWASQRLSSARSGVSVLHLPHIALHTCWSRWASQRHSSARSGLSVSHPPHTAWRTCRCVTWRSSVLHWLRSLPKLWWQQWWPLLSERHRQFL